MIRALAITGLMLIWGCDDGVPFVETSEPVTYVAGRVDQVKISILEVSVVIRNPTKQIDANRFAACMAAGWAQSRGYLFVERLRGNLRIDGAVHDNTVRYQTYRLTEPEDKEVFSAGLTKSVCEIEGIPVNEEQIEEFAGDQNI